MLLMLLMLLLLQLLFLLLLLAPLEESGIRRGHRGYPLLLLQILELLFPLLGHLNYLRAATSQGGGIGCGRGHRRHNFTHSKESTYAPSTVDETQSQLDTQTQSRSRNRGSSHWRCHLAEGTTRSTLAAGAQHLAEVAVQIAAAGRRIGATGKEICVQGAQGGGGGGAGSREGSNATDGSRVAVAVAT